MPPVCLEQVSYLIPANLVRWRATPGDGLHSRKRGPLSRRFTGSVHIFAQRRLSVRQNAHCQPKRLAQENSLDGQHPIYIKNSGYVRTLRGELAIRLSTKFRVPGWHPPEGHVSGLMSPLECLVGTTTSYSLIITRQYARTARFRHQGGALCKVHCTKPLCFACWRTMRLK